MGSKDSRPNAQAPGNYAFGLFVRRMGSTKKPRKSKKNPSPALSAEQKAANKALSQVRIFVEHAIGGMKRYNILVHAFRNRIKNFEDDVIGVCAGLWNLVLSY